MIYHEGHEEHEGGVGKVLFSFSRLLHRINARLHHPLRA
jgi:hypothetical protein